MSTTTIAVKLRPVHSSPSRRALGALMLLALCWATPVAVAQDKPAGEPAAPAATQPAPAAPPGAAPAPAGQAPTTPTPAPAPVAPGRPDKSIDGGFGWLAIGTSVILALAVGFALG